MGRAVRYFLNVQREEVIARVKACWSSVSSRLVQSYARGRVAQEGRANIKMAVIVQQMIIGDVSGVAFSAHPVTANSSHVVIEASQGLGEKVVSGRVTPDSYIIDKSSLKTIEAANQSGVLDHTMLTQLAKEIIKSEDYFGFPVDVEWTFAGNNLWILQARPITTL